MSIAPLASLIGWLLAVAAPVQDPAPPGHDQVVPAPENRPIRLSPNETSVSIAPYLVDLNETHAQIAWRTSEPTTGTFTWTDLDTGATQSLELDTTQQHGIYLRELAAGRDYQWSTSTGRSGTFRTLSPGQTRRFAIVGHTHGSEHFGPTPTTCSRRASARLARNSWCTAGMRSITPHCPIGKRTSSRSSSPSWTGHPCTSLRAIMIRVGRSWTVSTSAGSKSCSPTTIRRPSAPDPKQRTTRCCRAPCTWSFFPTSAPWGPDHPSALWLESTLEAIRRQIFEWSYSGGFNHYYDKAGVPCLPGRSTDRCGLARRRHSSWDPENE